MKANNCVLLLAAVVVVLMVTSCNDGLTHEPVVEVENALTLDEAEAYFEQTMMQMPEEIRNMGFNELVPKDLVPEWSESVSTHYGNISCLNVPIKSREHFQGRYMQSGEERVVTIAQKLVLLKNRDTSEKALFVLALIPCYGYEDAHEGEDIADLFVQGGSKNGFSGLALFIRPETGIVFCVSSFINGHRTDIATSSSDKATKARLTKQASRVKFYRVKSAKD